MDALADLARRAFWMGWAATAGPITPRVIAACRAACESAEAHPDAGPYPMLLIGQLEGTWAAIFTRREKLLSRVLAEIRASFRPALDRLDLPDLIRDARTATGLGEKTPDDQRAALQATAGRWLHRMTEDSAWPRLRGLLSQAIAHARAEGATDALAQLAAEAGIPVPDADFTAAFEHMYAALDELGDSAADTYLARALDGTAARLGGRLAPIAREQGSYAQMLDAADEVLDEGMDLELAVDDALSTGLSQGALDLYDELGVGQISWLTAADERVCIECDSNAAGSPYAADQAPSMPEHSRCRCVWAAADVSLPGSVFADYGMRLVASLLT